MTAVRKDEPLFGSTRDALRFAMNHRMALPRPVMNKMMADGSVMRIELADGTRHTVVTSRPPPRSEQLKGLDGAATAGFVLAHVARLPDIQQLVLMASSMKPTHPCSCGAPCCMGHRPNRDYQVCVSRICDHLKNEAQLTKLPGKKGLSTPPLMRQLLVQKHLQPKTELTIVDLAATCDVTEQTVIAHRRPILKFLEVQTDAGWAGLDESLSLAGIVGFLR